MSGEMHELDPMRYLLGELDDDERAIFEGRMREDDALRAQVSETEELIVAMRALPRDAWTPAAPPPLQIPLNGAVDTAKPEGDERSEGAPRSRSQSAPTPRKSKLGRFRVPVVAGAAAALVASGIAIGLLVSGDDTSPSPGAAQVLSTSDLRPAGVLGRSSSGSARILRGADGERDLAVSVRGMPQTSAGRYYELWLMRGNRLVSLGGFKVGPGGRRSVQVPLPVDPADFRLIDISLERADGNPGHSSVSLLRGPA